MRLEMDRPSSPGPSHNLPPPPAMEATQDPPTSADRAAAARKVHNISSPVGVMHLPPRSKQLVVCGTISTDKGQHHLVQCLLDPAAETNVCSREFAVSPTLALGPDAPSPVKKPLTCVQGTCSTASRWPRDVVSSSSRHLTPSPRSSRPVSSH